MWLVEGLALVGPAWSPPVLSDLSDVESLLALSGVMGIMVA